MEVNPGTWGYSAGRVSHTVSRLLLSQKPSGWRQTIGIDCGKMVCGWELLRANPCVAALRWGSYYIVLTGLELDM